MLNRFGVRSFITEAFPDAEFIVYDMCCAGDDGQLCSHIGPIEFECE